MLPFQVTTKYKIMGWPARYVRRHRRITDFWERPAPGCVTDTGQGPILDTGSDALAGPRQKEQLSTTGSKYPGAHETRRTGPTGGKQLEAMKKLMLVSL